MMEELTQLLLGAGAFISTNLDDLVLLSALFALPGLRPASIVAGQLLGIGGLVAASAVAALTAMTMPGRWTAVLGVVPLGIGINQLFFGLPERSGEVSRARTLVSVAGVVAQIAAVAALTIANGGDNLAIYIPLFTCEPACIPYYAAIFAVLTGAWCWLCHRLVTRGVLAGPIRRYAPALLPLVLMAIGLYVLSGVLEFGPEGF